MTATFYVGDCIEVMGKLPEKSVDLVLTSPPFLALRSYLPADHPDKALEGGSQATPGEYIDWLLDVVEACERVLAPHGSLCFELGDTYSGSGGAGGDYAPGGTRDGQPKFSQAKPCEHGFYEPHPVLSDRDPRLYSPTGCPGGEQPKTRTLHPDTDGRHSNSDPDRRELRYNRSGVGGRGWPLAKTLSLIPESFRFAMVYGVNPHTGRRTAPWRLRNVIRWVRPNPPVGALGDKFRPATSELMVFCKAKDRFFDLDAVREPMRDHSLEYWHGSAVTKATPEMGGHIHGGRKKEPPNASGAPPLDWWNIPPGGYPGAHYAVWPPELLIKPIKAMSPEKVCRVCGEASRRIVETAYQSDRGGPIAEETAWRNGRGGEIKGMSGGMSRVDRPRAIRSDTTLGFSDCGHNNYRSGLVLDPFAGSGTTLAVATGHGRDAIGIDLDERNYDLALDRVGPFILTRAAS